MNPRDAPAIEAGGPTKQFDDVLAVDRVDFDVLEGGVFGFLGPNGAGKTATINMLIGLARPNAGYRHILNASPCPLSGT